MSLPRPRTQASHQGAKGRMRQLVQLTFNCTRHVSGPSRDHRLPSPVPGPQVQSFFPLCLAPFPHFGGILTQLLSPEVVSHNCALVPQTGACNSFSRRFISAHFTVCDGDGLEPPFSREWYFWLVEDCHQPFSHIWNET